MTDSYKSHTVAQNDTIEGLAARYLGSAIRWREIAALNKLRAPFISADPAEWFGPVQATGVLAAETATNDTALTVVGERDDIVRPSSILFVDGYDPAGRYLYEALPVRDYNNGTGLLRLFTPFRYGWPIGTRWVVFAPQRDGDTRVARPGEAVLLPVPVGQVGTLLLSETDFVQLYGIDIELHPATGGGNLVWADGDLRVVRGRTNIKQALRMKADLPKGMNLFHPDEGSRVHELLGEPGSPANLIRARNYNAEALARDPRVMRIASSHAAVSLDRIEVTTEVELANSPNAVRVDAVILRG